MLGRDPDAAQEWLRSWTAQVSTQAQAAAELSDRVQRLPGAELSRLIMATVSRAQARLAAEVSAAVADTVGVDSESGRAVVDSYVRRFPVSPDDDADRLGDDAGGGRRGW